jgi:hypothetical protein
MNFARTIAAAPLAVLLLTALPRAQENLELGKMWLTEDPPLGYLKQEYGFAPDATWFERLRLASIRFGSGCSSSFVSPQGLIMTNHHCVRGQIAEVQGDDDWVADGFYARSLEDEVKIPGLTVQQVVDIRDVTADVDAGITEADDDAARTEKRNANMQRIVAAAAAPGMQPQVVTLFQGAKFHLYTYKIWDDIRLVCAPHLQTAHFGGDFDNFTFPRWCLDFAFVRAYVDGKPADTSSHFFRWCTDGIREGELVFVTGNPGTTKRLLTLAQMEYLRDVFHPIVQGLVDSRLRIRKQLVAEDPSREKQLRTEILSWENSQKAYRGYWDGLLDPSLMEQKAAAEAAFRQRVADDPELQARFGDVWDRLAEVAAERRELEAKVRFQTTAGHPVLTLGGHAARAIDQGATATAREDAANRARRLRAELEKTGIDALAVREFVDHLERAQDWLQAGDPWLNLVVGNREPAAVAAILADSALLDAEQLESILADRWAGQGQDPAFAMARSIVPMMDANRLANDRLNKIEEAQGARIGQALFGAYGSSVSPDATLTLRFSDGVVKGYPYNGTIAPYWTSFYGLYAREHEFGGEYPFVVPQIWKDRKDRIDMTKPMDFVSTNDIIGGNSGSPLVNANLEIVGLVFDGNIEMLPNRYVYRSELPRSVSVHVDGIMEALVKIYDADRIVDELRGTK